MCNVFRKSQSCERALVGQFVRLCEFTATEHTGCLLRLQSKSFTNQSHHSSFKCSMRQWKSDFFMGDQHLPLDLTWRINTFFSPFFSVSIQSHHAAANFNWCEKGEQNTLFVQTSLGWMNRCYSWIRMELQKGNAARLNPTLQWLSYLQIST